MVKTSPCEGEYSDSSSDRLPRVKFLVDSTLGERARLLTGEGGFETHSTSQ